MRVQKPADRLRHRWGANSSRQDRQGRTPLHYAAWSDDADSVKLVLASSCLVHVSDINGRTAIFDTNTAEVTELLLAWGADINHVDHHGDTPLLYSACQGRSQEAIKALIDFGSNVAAVDKNGRDAILTAVEWNAPETLHALLVALGDSNATKVGTSTRPPTTHTGFMPHLVPVKILFNFSSMLR